MRYFCGRAKHEARCKIRLSAQTELYRVQKIGEGRHRYGFQNLLVSEAMRP